MQRGGQSNGTNSWLRWSDGPGRLGNACIAKVEANRDLVRLGSAYTRMSQRDDVRADQRLFGRRPAVGYRRDVRESLCRSSFRLFREPLRRRDAVQLSPSTHHPVRAWLIRSWTAALPLQHPD